jgi:hypothetical protein
MRSIKAIILTVIALTLGTAYSQTKSFDIVIEGGPGLAFFGSTLGIYPNFQPNIGLTGGISLQKKIQEHISIRAGLAFERKGSKNGEFPFTDEFGNISGTGSGQTNLDYFILPVLFRASLGKKVQLIVDFGAYFGYLVKGVLSVSGTNIPEYFGDGEFNITYDCKRIDIGASTGLGLSIPVKPKLAILLDIRSNLGLVKFNGINRTVSTNFLLGCSYNL